ncbi:ski2-type helicase, partial [Candidatus Bathyarchaeota archaeon]|nr:ski2-type helicase [Candidatus Bathyarchaeota archaeon]
LHSWIEEKTEDEIIERFGVEPGDLYRLIETAKWLLYATHELALLFGHKDLIPLIAELSERVSKGVRKELIQLARLEGVGRVRARILYNAGYKTVDDLRLASIDKLMALPMIGPKLAKKIKDQVGGYLKKEQYERLKEDKESWKQKALTEY